mgnify:CR=1 FL=1
MNMDLMSLLGRIGISAQAERAEDIRYNIKAFFTAKKGLPQSEYIQQLEKNVPYAKACCLRGQQAIVEHIHSGKRQLGNDEAYLELINNVRYMAMSDAKPVIEFLAGRGEARDDDLTRYFTYVKGLKFNGEATKYLDEMEFQLKFYQAIFDITQFYTYIITRKGNESLVSSLRNCANRVELQEQLSHQIKADANLCISNVSVVRP